LKLKISERHRNKTPAPFFHIDRTAPICNNILELATMPYTVGTATDLYADPTYKFQQDWLLKAISKVSAWINKIEVGDRILISTAILTAAIVIGYLTGGIGLVGKILTDVCMGVGVGVIGYGAIAILLGESPTREGLTEAAVNAFFISSIFVFVSVSINALKYVCRSKPTVIDGVEIQKAQKSDFTSESWNKIQSLDHRADGSTISSMRDGRFIHKGFKSEAGGLGKELYKKGIGRIDYFDATTKTIFELKPNNAWSIKKGIQQLHRYNAGMGGGYKLVLVLY